MSDEAAGSSVEDIESPEENDVMEGDSEFVESPNDHQEDIVDSEDEECVEDEDYEIEESDYFKILIEEMSRQHSIYATHYSAHIQKIGIIIAFATIGLIQILFFMLSEDALFQKYTYIELAMLAISILLILVSCILGLYAVWDSRLGSPSVGCYLPKLHYETKESGRYLDAYFKMINDEFVALDDIDSICADLRSLSRMMAALLVIGISTLLVFVTMVVL